MTIQDRKWIIGFICKGKDLLIELEKAQAKQ